MRFGVDLGGTKTEIRALDGTGREVLRRHQDVLKCGAIDLSCLHASGLSLLNNQLQRFYAAPTYLLHRRFYG